MSFLLDHAALISLLFFFFVFVGIVIRTIRPSAKKSLQDHAFIPLKEE